MTGSCRTGIVRDVSEVGLAAAMTAPCQAKSAARVGHVPYRPSDDNPQHRTSIDYCYSWEALPQKVAAQNERDFDLKVPNFIKLTQRKTDRRGTSSVRESEEFPDGNAFQRSPPLPHGRHYTRQRPNIVANCGDDVALKARSQPMGTCLPVRTRGGCDLGPFLVAAGALVTRSRLWERSTDWGSETIPSVLGNDGNDTKIIEQSAAATIAHCVTVLRISTSRPRKHTHEQTIERVLRSSRTRHHIYKCNSSFLR
jgi:hypothetical protein